MTFFLYIVKNTLKLLRCRRPGFLSRDLIPFAMNNSLLMLLAGTFAVALTAFVVPPAAGQTVVPISGSLETTGGQEYFLHTVAGGQTYFSIANAYRVPLDRVRQENPQSGDMLQVGTVLRIPVTPQNAELRPASAQAPQTDGGGQTATPQTAAGDAQSPNMGTVRQITSERLRPGEVTQRRAPRTAPGSQLEDGTLTFLEVINLEHQLDQMISQALNNFFDPDHYLLHVGVDVSTRFYQQQVPIPVVQERPIRIDEQLPGLPFVPPELLRDLGPTRQVETGTLEYREVRVPEVDRIRIVLWADTLFSDNELDLMRQVVEAKVFIDPARGDQFELVQQPFRKKPAPQMAVTGPDRYFFLLLFAVTLFTILSGLLGWYLYRSLNYRKIEAEYAGMAALSAGSVHAESGRMDLPMLGAGQGQSTHRFLMETNGKDSGTKSRHYIMQVILHHPEQIGRLFSYWHENDGEHTLLHAATILQSIDPKLLGMLRHTMSDEVFFKLEEMIREPLIQPQNQKDDLLLRFAEQLRSRQEQSENKDEFSILPTFDFLHYIDDEKLIEVLASENERVKALVLSHLPSGRRSSLLKQFGMDEAGRILFCLPQVRNMPFQEYERIASRLFHESYYSSEIGGSVTDRDIEQIVMVIESLPVSDQEKYISQLDEIVSELADAVRERVITMETVLELDDELLAEAVTSMSREDLAAALVDTGEELRSRILQFRPDREVEVIRDEIENQALLNRDNIDEARAKLLKKLRESREDRKMKARKMLPVRNGDGV